jgi:hypothetical protein
MIPIPDELKLFIFTCFETVVQLRILLLLQASPERAWSATSVSATLSLRTDVARSDLNVLRQQGLLTVSDNANDQYRYQPASADLAQMVRAVVELDRTRPVTLIKLIYSRPKNVC